VKHHDGTAVYWGFLGLLAAAMALRVAAWLLPGARRTVQAG
jgi:hypothetical protein